LVNLRTLSISLLSFNLFTSSTSINNLSFRNYFNISSPSSISLSSNTTNVNTFFIYNSKTSTSNLTISTYILSPGDLISVIWTDYGAGLNFYFIPISNLIYPISNIINNINTYTTLNNSHTSTLNSISTIISATNINNITTKLNYIDGILNTKYVFTNPGLVSFSSIGPDNYFFITTSTTYVTMAVNTKSITKFSFTNSKSSTLSFNIYYDLLYTSSNILSNINIGPGQRCVLLWVNNNYILLSDHQRYIVFKDSSSPIILVPNSNNFLFELTNNNFHTEVKTSFLLNLELNSVITLSNLPNSISQLYINWSSINNNNIYLFPGEQCSFINMASQLNVLYSPKTSYYTQPTNIIQRIFYTNIFSPENIRLKILNLSLTIPTVATGFQISGLINTTTNRLYKVDLSYYLPAGNQSLTKYISPYNIGFNTGVYMSDVGVNYEPAPLYLGMGVLHFHIVFS
jgi:hypothetical protein